MKSKLLWWLGGVASVAIVFGLIFLVGGMRARLDRGAAAESSHGEVAAEYDEAAPAPSAEGAGSGGSRFDATSPVPELHGAKLVKTGSITLKASDTTALDQARSFLRALASRHHAYFAKEEDHREGSTKSFSLVARIPADRFDAFVDDLSRGGYRTLSKSIEVSDETQHYIDLEARLKNRHALLDRYRDLLRRGTRVNDLLSINQSMESVSGEIDSLEGQLRYLTSQVAFSTLSISFSADLPHAESEPNSFATDLRLSLGEGLGSLRGWVLWGASCWFLLVLAAPAVPLALLARRRWALRGARAG